MVAFNSRRRSAVALGAAAVLAVGLAASQIPPSASARPGLASSSSEVLPYQDPTLPTSLRVADLLDRMTLAEKIGQMTQAERATIDSDTSMITSLNLGSVLSGGGSVPTPNTPEAWADMVDRYQAAALNTRLGIPLIYGVDTVHGDGNMHGATVFPHNIGLGATRDPALVARVGTSPRRRRGRPGRSGPSHPASAWRATTAGAASTSRSARPGARGEDGHRDRRLPGPGRPPRRQRPGAGHGQALRR